MNTNPSTTGIEFNIKLEGIREIVDHFDLEALFLLASKEVIYGKV